MTCVTVGQMMRGLECGHLYCTSCWTEYLTTKIMDEGASQMIECPGECRSAMYTYTSDTRFEVAK